MCGKTFCSCKMVYALPARDCLLTLSALDGPDEQLLESWVADARRHGVPAARVVSWVRRKFGAHMTVYRCRKDGSLGCSTPCLLCSRELARFDIKVHCSLEGGAWYSGRVTDVGAPAPILTSGQRRMIRGKAACLAERTLKKVSLPISFR